jgi:hypothetical protein
LSNQQQALLIEAAHYFAEAIGLFLEMINVSPPTRYFMCDVGV